MTDDDATKGPRRIWPRLTRDSVTYVLAVGGLFHEMVIHTGAERPWLLGLLAGMLGLPAVLRRDENQPKG